MNHQPTDYVTVEYWCANYGVGALASPKLLSYHTMPHRKELILAGAIAKVGSRIYLHKELFWTEFQRIQLEAEEATKISA